MAAVAPIPERAALAAILADSENPLGATRLVAFVCSREASTIRWQSSELRSRALSVLWDSAAAASQTFRTIIDCGCRWRELSGANEFAFQIRFHMRNGLNRHYADIAGSATVIMTKTLKRISLLLGLPDCQPDKVDRSAQDSERVQSRRFCPGSVGLQKVFQVSIVV
jgi:hypothetical protein